MGNLHTAVVGPSNWWFGGLVAQPTHHIKWQMQTQIQRRPLEMSSEWFVSQTAAFCLPNNYVINWIYAQFVQQATCKFSCQ